MKLPSNHPGLLGATAAYLGIVFNMSLQLPPNRVAFSASMCFQRQGGSSRAVSGCAPSGPKVLPESSEAADGPIQENKAAGGGATATG